MAIPSGSGTEVLKRMSIANQSSVATLVDWAQVAQTAVTNSAGTVDVPPEVIITILNIIICNADPASRTVDIMIKNSGSPSDIQILQDQPIGANQTFVFSDKMILRDNDQLYFLANDNNVFIHINYIYQDWT